MLRFVPPHLMVLITLFLGVVWLMLVRHFRQSSAIQNFVAETFGDNTPESALQAFELARVRLADHLKNCDLDDQTRSRIETALGTSSQADAVGCPANDAFV